MRVNGNILGIGINAAVFILLEVAALIMLHHSGPLQNIWISKGMHAVYAAVWGGADDLKSYFSLKKQNKALAEENFRLSAMLRCYRGLTGVELSPDSIPDIYGGYRYMMASAIKVSNNRQHNYIVIDKGSEDGVRELSGIVTKDGVVGIVDAISRHYSYGRSFKNPDMVVSARIGREGPVGELMWDGISSNGAVLREIPQHIPVHRGDTVYTSGFSSIFPADIPLGTTGEATVVNGSTYNIEITLFTDFSSLRYVTVVDNVDRDEIRELEDRYAD